MVYGSGWSPAGEDLRRAHSGSARWPTAEKCTIPTGILGRRQDRHHVLGILSRFSQRPARPPRRSGLPHGGARSGVAALPPTAGSSAPQPRETSPSTVQWPRKDKGASDPASVMASRLTLTAPRRLAALFPNCSPTRQHRRGWRRTGADHAPRFCWSGRVSVDVDGVRWTHPIRFLTGRFGAQVPGGARTRTGPSGPVLGVSRSSQDGAARSVDRTTHCCEAREAGGHVRPERLDVGLTTVGGSSAQGIGSALDPAFAGHPRRDGAWRRTGDRRS